ncbi:MAG: hypothetical protein GXO10_02695 [Crenarchaeota archaeon]|jgi:flagellar capping protein FliD|nr:hypothetical protein [Thermoproteota archaeon]NPB00259.1 hypothetical protein [Thermoproteota archaeon]
MSSQKGLREQIEDKMKELVGKYMSEITQEIDKYHKQLLDMVNRIKEQIR